MKTFFRKKAPRFSLAFVAFWQALGLTLYCSLVGVFLWRAERWAGPPHTFLGPTFFLILFVVSAIISALIVLGRPFILFWEKKQTKEALKLVLWTSVWLLFFALLLIVLLIIF